MTPVVLLVCVSFFYLVLQQSWHRAAAQEATFLAFTVIFLTLVLTPAELIWLSAFMTLGFIVIEGARRFREHNPTLFIVPLVVLFAVFKRYEIFPLQRFYAHIPELAGLSFIIFRVINVLFEAQESGESPGPIEYVTFCLSPFTYLSGPIQRFRNFREDMARRNDFRLTEVEGASAMTRFMNGVIKAVFIGPFVQGCQFFFMHADKAAIVIRSGGLTTPARYGLAALCYLLFLYLNFSGYTDMMLGLGRLFGFRLPENFNNPFAATSFLDFWSRWHISLSLWFRDYCFSPILKKMIKAGIKNPVLATMPAYFVSFGLLGLWHGRTWPFLLCGLMFSIGSVANHFYNSIVLGGMRKERQKKLNRNRAYQALTSAFTFFYIAVAITGLWLPGPEFAALVRSFGKESAVFSFGLVIMGLATLIHVVRILSLWPPIQKIFLVPVSWFFECKASLMIAVKVALVMVWFFSFSTNLPDFIYQGF
jgi:alginate O-acetyltransferase complex protein AlgI